MKEKLAWLAALVLLSVIPILLIVGIGLVSWGPRVLAAGGARDPVMLLGIPVGAGLLVLCLFCRNWAFRQIDDSFYLALIATGNFILGPMIWAGALALGRGYSDYIGWPVPMVFVLYALYVLIRQHEGDYGTK